MRIPENVWVNEFDGAVMVCDSSGIILEMNDRAASVYEKDGGRGLIGKNVLDCHPETARLKIERLMKDRQPNVYTVEKDGVNEFVYQSPWYRDGAYAGFLEISLEIPFEMPHFVRG